MTSMQVGHSFTEVRGMGSGTSSIEHVFSGLLLLNRRETGSRITSIDRGVHHEAMSSSKDQDSVC